VDTASGDALPKERRKEKEQKRQKEVELGEKEMKSVVGKREERRR
jgi:hypothetical protein